MNIVYKSVAIIVIKNYSFKNLQTIVKETECKFAFIIKKIV